MKLTLSILALLVLATSTLIAAGTCTPDSGFDWCYSDSYSYGDATARSEVQGTYPECDGERSENKCVGEWYIDVKGGKDGLYIYQSVTSWDELWDDVANCNENGCSGYRYPAEIKHRTFTSNEPSGKVPGYVLVGWDYNKASNGDWAWAISGGGYTVEFFSGLETVECISGDKCEGTSWIKCENYEWVNKGQLIPKCGVECITDNDCNRVFSITGSTTKFCSGFEIKDTIETSKCSNYICSPETKIITIETCELGCEMIDGIPKCIVDPIDPIEIATPLIITIAVILILIVIGGIVLVSRKK